MGVTPGVPTSHQDTNITDSGGRYLSVTSLSSLLYRYTTKASVPILAPVRAPAREKGERDTNRQASRSQAGNDPWRRRRRRRENRAAKDDGTAHPPRRLLENCRRFHSGRWWRRRRRRRWWWVRVGLRAWDLSGENDEDPAVKKGTAAMGGGRGAALATETGEITGLDSKVQKSSLQPPLYWAPWLSHRRKKDEKTRGEG